MNDLSKGVVYYIQEISYLPTYNHHQNRGKNFAVSGEREREAVHTKGMYKYLLPCCMGQGEWSPAGEKQVLYVTQKRDRKSVV